jgi:VanZ family protein
MKATSPTPHRTYAILPISWTIIMLWLTLTPSKNLPPTPEWKLLSFDTAAHAGIFAVLAVLSWFSLSRQQRWPALARHAGMVVLVGCVIFGALIEVVQYSMRLGRNAEWTDLLGDSVGAALALLLVIGGWRWWQRRQLATSALLVLLLLSSSLFFALSAQAQAPDLVRARHTIEELASPKMHGRGYVQGGEHQAAAYLRGRLRQLGLQPLAPDYTQPFGLDVNTFAGKMQLNIIPAVEDAAPVPQPLKPGSEFIVAPESGPASAAFSVYLHRFDTLAFSREAAQRTLQKSFWQVAHHTNSLLPKQNGLVLTAKQEQQLRQLPISLQRTLDSAAARIVLVPKLTASLAAEQLTTVRIEALDTLPVWRFHVNSPNLFTAYAQIQLDAKLLHDYQTQNLAAIVRGKMQPDSFLVVSAHYDHLGMMGKGTYFPGANDNASGVALLLELATHYARPENQPSCSVVFLLFGAEEAGLVGSRYFVAHPLVPLPRIKFLINLDLLGTGEEGATVVNGKVFEPAYQRLTALNDAHHYLPRLTARGRAANSDHFPFSEAGVPAFFIYTRGGSTAYHDVNDQPAALSLAGFSGAFGLVRDFLDSYRKP